ncbi:MAG: hypothetical protein DLM58_23285 [Pseudonocardiales bacterium]|nr:MAG: hypothetical protein DLM58_23285 [Pseudonocardiales bacterium]
MSLIVKPSTVGVDDAVVRFGLAPEAGSVYRQRRPAGSARQVDAVWRQRVVGDYSQLVLPDGAADVIVDQDGRAVLVGPTSAPQRVILPGGSSYRGLRLRPGAVGSVLGLGADTLRDLTVDLDDVVGRRAARLLTAAAAGDGGAWQALNVELAEVDVDWRVDAAVRMLGARRQVSVAEVAVEVGMSDRQLRRLFHRHAGLGPKTVQRIQRLHRFLDLAERRPGRGEVVALGVLCVEVGYSDQPHLNREVATLTGHSPADLLAVRRAASE